MSRNRVQKIKHILVYLPVAVSLAALILCTLLFFRIRDIEERLKSVSLNSYVEQTVVSNNYYVAPGGSTAELPVAETQIVVPGERQAARKKTVYLTFDDGPSPNTERILKILKQHNVKATFFVDGIGEGKEGLDDKYKAIVDDGHTIAMHSYSHEYGSLYSSVESFEDDLDKIHSLIYNKTGVDATIYRFPGGSGNHVSKLDMGAFADVLHARGYEYWDWNVYPGNSTGRSIPADQIIAGILDHIDSYDSAIVLLHDTAEKNTTVDALPEVIEGLLERDIELQPMSMDTPLIQQVAK